MFWLLRCCTLVCTVVLLFLEVDAKTLHFAAETGDTARVRALLAQGVNVDKRDNRGRTALIYAASRGYLAVVNMLLAKGADVHAEGRHQLNPLNAAIMRNRLSVVKRLVEAGADIHLGDLEGKKPLFIAVEQGFLDIVRVLLENGANANTLSPRNNSVSNVARENGHSEIEALLLKHGANPAQDRFRGLTVATNIDTVMIRKALEEGVEAGKALRMAVELNDTSLVRKLLDQGVDINAKTEGDVTPLMVATGLGNLPLVQALLNAGADPFLQDKNGRTAYAYTLFIRDQNLRRQVTEVVRSTMYGRIINR